METSTQRALLLFEKLISTETFLLVLASILFADMYLMLFHGLTVFAINIPIREIDVTVKQAAAFVLAYSAFFGMVAPMFAVAIDTAMKWRSFSKRMPYGYVSLETLKQDALREQNSFMYKHYENVMMHLEKAARIRRLSIAIVLLLLITVGAALFRANGAVGSLLQATWIMLAEDGAASYLLRILVFCAGLVLFFVAVDPAADINNSEHLPAYGFRFQNEWIEEIKVGLIDKDTLLGYLRSVVDDAFQGEKYDPSNESHKFCVKHGLANHREGKLAISDKGKFFKRFL